MYNYRLFNQSFHKILFLPIYVHLYEIKKSLPQLVKEMRESGLNYSFSGLSSVRAGHSIAKLNFNYFATIYNFLNLDPPTPESLMSAYVKYLSIQEEKKARAEANKAKKQKNID
jgi:hypothetical protein